MVDEVHTECAFMIPLVRNGDRRPHRSSAWRALADEINAAFVTGSSGPERIYQLSPVPGTYTDVHGRLVEDESWRFFIALPWSRVGELKCLLARACNTFDQEAIYLAVAGRVELVRGGPEDGELVVRS